MNKPLYGCSVKNDIACTKITTLQSSCWYTERHAALQQGCTAPIYLGRNISSVRMAVNEKINLLALKNTLNTSLPNDNSLEQFMQLEKQASF